MPLPESATCLCVRLGLRRGRCRVAGRLLSVAGRWLSCGLSVGRRRQTDRPVPDRLACRHGSMFPYAAGREQHPHLTLGSLRLLPRLPACCRLGGRRLSGCWSHLLSAVVYLTVAC